MFGAVVELARNIRASFNRESVITSGAQRVPDRPEVAPRRPEEPAPPDPGTMPDFVIIGAQKCGTTFLYNLLAMHPHVEPATRKEVHYFDRRSDKGPRWYRSHFPPPTRKRGRRSITGESTPYYLFHPLAPERMARVVPEARLIALLRNPIDRAYSHYHQEAKRGHEPLTFEEAIEAEGTRLQGEEERMLEDVRYVSFNHQNFSYLSRGIYVDQLLEWSRFFGDEQMLVLKSEDLFARTSDALVAVCGFLDLPRWSPGASDPSLEGRYPPMKAATRRLLRGYFEPHNQRLYEYLGVDFGW